MNLKVLHFFFLNFINECLLFAIYFVVKCEFVFMFVFVIGFVFIFVILKEKIINHQENVKLIFFFFFIRLGWIGPRIRGFRLGLEAAGRGLRGPDEASLVLKKKSVY